MAAKETIYLSFSPCGGLAQLGGSTGFAAYTVTGHIAILAGALIHYGLHHLTDFLEVSSLIT